MIVVKIFGGLGNQMFQYSFGRALSVKTGLEVVYYVDCQGERQFGLSTFNIKGKFEDVLDIKGISSIKNKLMASLNRRLNYKLIPIYKQKYIYDSNLSFNKNIFLISDNTFLEGYWQSEKYFEGIEDLLYNELKFVSDIDERNSEIIKMTSTVNSVSLHVRRGDYVTDAKANAVHGLCDKSYYYNAINYILKNVPDPHFFIFSDDMDWVKKELTINGSVVYVDFNKKDSDDLRLMSKCKHNIIANSTFSWWGAWLNNNPQKIVIAPKKWFESPERSSNDLIPPSWIKV